MMNSRSVDLRSSRLPEQIARLRQQRGWSKADLAAKAGLSAKVIHQIESRSRDKYLEKTLLLLAEALEVELADLLQLPPRADVDGPAPEKESIDAIPPQPPEPARPHRRGGRVRRALLVFAAAAVLFVAVFTLLTSSRPAVAPMIEHRDGTVTARDPVSGNVLWTRSFASKVWFADPAPWRNGTVLVGVSYVAADGGRVLLLDGRSGATHWERAPSAELAAAAFGMDALDGLGAFGPILWRAIDLEGDGEPQVAIAFIHVRMYPSSVLILDRRGDVVGEYMNRGHVYDMLAVDLDGHGRQALVCVGCNNKEPHHGGAVFILDREHRHGAAVDAFNGGDLAVGDGSRSRILIPALEPQMMQWLGQARLSAYRVMTTTTLDGTLAFMVTVGTEGLDLQLLLDADLNPLDVRPTDIVPVTIAGWPVADPANYGPNCSLWRDEWLRRIVKLGARHPAQVTLHE